MARPLRARTPVEREREREDLPIPRHVMLRGAWRNVAMSDNRGEEFPQSRSGMKSPSDLHGAGSVAPRRRPEEESEKGDCPESTKIVASWESGVPDIPTIDDLSMLAQPRASRNGKQRESSERAATYKRASRADSDSLMATWYSPSEKDLDPVSAGPIA